ncbi:MAG: TolC family protein [Vicinamibacteria bacterium]|nr:TolC family protein [Vicinamibacteria bacterium]
MRHIRLFPPLIILTLFVSPGLKAEDADPDPQTTLELSLDGAVERALESNVDIAVARYTPESSAAAVRGAGGAYDPTFSSTLSKTSQTDRAQNVFAGAETVDTDLRSFNFGLTQLIPTGAQLSLAFNNRRTDTNSEYSTFNPSFYSSFEARFTQPLLRNLRMDASRYQLRVAKKNREISDIQFRQTVVNTVANVKKLYYSLIYAIDNLEAQRKSLALARKFLEENQIKVRVGTLAPLEVVSAEAEVAGREETVILAESNLANAEDALKRALFSENDEQTWGIKIIPTDRPSAEAREIDLDAAIKTALEKRTDVTAARKSLERSETQLKYNMSRFLPALDFIATYTTTGIGGTQLIRDEGPLAPITRTIEGGYGDAVGDVFGRKYPTWVVGLNFTYPLLNRQASANKAQARINRDQALASLRRLEMDVVNEVRSAARAVEANFKRVAATRAARVLSEKRLDAEQKKFAAGMSTNFLVTQAQRDLSLAEVNELQAIADYRKSVIDFDRVQEAGGGNISIVTSAGNNS